MKASDVKMTAPMKPSPEGNIVYIKGIEYTETDKGNSYKVSFVEKDTNAEYEPMLFDPFTHKADLNPKLVQAGYNKLFRIARAYMTTEAYNAFAQIDLADLKTAIATIKKMVDPSWLNLETRLIWGYSKRTGYPQLPTFSEFISTPLAEQELDYPVDELSAKKVESPTHPRAASGATPDVEQTATKANVNDDV